MISILLPTRKRPAMARRFIESVLQTADHPDQVEFILRLDEDDKSYDDWRHIPQAHLYIGERKTLSECYLWENARGDIFFMGGDDLIFHTQGWDTKVEAEFAKVPDKILLVYGDDGDPNTEKVNASHSFIHRNWVNAVGRYLPPYFSGDFPDTWLTFLADGVGRKVKIDIVTEHMHPAFGKREQDVTDKEKWEKHFRDDMPQKYLDTLPEREADVVKLKKFIEEFK